MKAAPIAAHATAPPMPSVPAPIPAPAVVTDLASVLANVALADAAWSGVEGARRVAEAVRARGLGDPFLQHLNWVAGTRSAESAG